jgi:hypothetical protein
MMPETTTQIIAQVISYLGTTPVLLTLVLLILGPMAAVVWVVWRLPKLVIKIAAKQDDRMQSVFDRQDQRFEQVVNMYKDNVQLVKDYERHVIAYRETNDKLLDLIAVSTGTQQTLVDYVKNNWWCPVSKDPGLLNHMKERRHEQP